MFTFTSHSVPSPESYVQCHILKVLERSYLNITQSVLFEQIDKVTAGKYENGMISVCMNYANILSSVRITTIPRQYDVMVIVTYNIGHLTHETILSLT